MWLYIAYYVPIHTNRQTHKMLQVVLIKMKASISTVSAQPPSHCFLHSHKFFVEVYFKATIQTECGAMILRKTILISRTIYSLSLSLSLSLFLPPSLCLSAHSVSQHSPSPYETPQGGCRREIKV